MEMPQQFHDADSAAPQLSPRQEAARHRNLQPLLFNLNSRYARSVGAVIHVSDVYKVDGLQSAYLDLREASLATALKTQNFYKTALWFAAEFKQYFFSAIGSPTFMSTQTDQNRHNTEPSDRQMNTASPTGSTWLGEPFCGSPIGVDLPLQAMDPRLAGSLQDSAVFSLHFADEVAMGQQDRRSHAVASPQDFQEHSFGHSGQQNVQAEAAQYTLDYALSFQGDSQIPDLQRGFVQQAANSGFESQVSMSSYGQEDLPQTMHNSQYPPTSAHVTLLQNPVGEGALVPVQQHVGRFQVVPNDHTQTAPLSPVDLDPVDLDAMANCDWSVLDATEEFINKLNAEYDRLGTEM
ncbi:hypothetical protein ACEPAI_8241 [Sanghuangporus weigelae]